MGLGRALYKMSLQTLHSLSQSHILLQINYLEYYIFFLIISSIAERNVFCSLKLTLPLHPQ
jgi:hypothetical protein